MLAFSSLPFPSFQSNQLILRCQCMQFLIGSVKQMPHFRMRSMIPLLTLLINKKMYNSEQIYTFQQERPSQGNQPDFDTHKNENFSNSRRKNNINLAHKSNSIIGTYTRIIPKKPMQDFERLYAENMQLKEKIKFLEEDNTKIKTRVTMAEKEKEQLITHIYKMDTNYSLVKDRRPSQKGLSVMKDQSKKMVNDENRRILHGYKDQISKLKLENARLKKTVKYTQIQQLQTQNQYLHKEMVKMKQYMQNVIENTQYEEYQQQIQVLGRQLQGERDANKTMHMQMKKKDEQIEEVKNKMKVLASRKVELQKKYTRDMNTAKEQLYRVKQKQAVQDRRQSIKHNKNERQSGCVNCKNIKQLFDKEKAKNNELQHKVDEQQKTITELKNKLKEMERKLEHEELKTTKTTNYNEKMKPVHSEKYEMEKSNKQFESSVGSKRSNKNKVSKNEQQKVKVEKEKAQTKQRQQSKKSEDDYNFDEDDDQEILYRTDKMNPSDDKVDVLYVDLNDSQQKEKKMKSPSKIQQQQKYDESFEDLKEHKDDNEEEILFQKEEKPKKRKSTSKAKGKEQKQKPEQKEKNPATKAEKILRQTIKYRLIAQRYTFPDFHRDIKDSQAVEFTAEQLIEMLSNQPFFLSEDHLKMVIYGLFEKQDIEPDDQIKVKAFLERMKQYIGQIVLQNQEQEESVLKQIQNKLKKKKIIPKLKAQANGNEISKKGFMKVLKESGGLSQQEIEQCLAEASVMSTDIAHINYIEFVEKIVGAS